MRLLLILFSLFLMATPSGAKKIKNSFKIEKESKTDVKSGERMRGEELVPSDSICTFTGYDKDINSNMESFILVNHSEDTITGFRIRIDYLDLQGRMLHSRIVKESCDVPPGEARRVDVRSWDKQHAYYYYLGNEPRRVATPFKVEFKLEGVWGLSRES